MTINKTYVFDTETTDKDNPEIIESSWMDLVFKGNRIEAGPPVTQRFKPVGKISMGALATHHILDEELVNCPPAANFKLPEDTRYIAGHNVDFDWRCAGSPEHIKRIDTLGIARKLWPELDSHSLGAIIYFLFRNEAKSMLTGAHSAEIDIANTVKVLNKIIDVTNIKSMDELWLYSEMARFPEVMTFGKHKGETVAYVIKNDRNYVDWYSNKSDNPDPYLVRALHGETAESFKAAYEREQAGNTGGSAPAAPAAPAATAEQVADVFNTAVKVDEPTEVAAAPSTPMKRRF